MYFCTNVVGTLEAAVSARPDGDPELRPSHSLHLLSLHVLHVLGLLCFWMRLVVTHTLILPPQRQRIDAELRFMAP